MSDFLVEPIQAGDLWHLGPEILLTLWGLVVLLLDVSVFRRRSNETRRLALGFVTLLGVVVVLGYLVAPAFRAPESGGAIEADPDPILFHGALAGDLLTKSFNGVIAVLLGMVVGMSMAWNFTRYWGAYYALLCWAAVGMMILIAAEELLVLFLALEMMTICLYLVAAFEKPKRRSAEAGMKYFVYGSVASALFLFGLSLIYGLTGTTMLAGIRLVLLDRAQDGIGTGLSGDVIGATAVVLLLVGFGFKIAAVPFHQWAPDAYEGAPAPVSSWIASGSKVASFIALMKVLIHALGPWAGEVGDRSGQGWIVIIGVIAALTMTYGNLAALAQRNFKRLLAYSSIAHAGYILVGVLAAAVTVRGPLAAEAAGSVLFYLVVYGITTVGAFAVAAWLARDKDHDDIDDLNGLGYESPELAGCIVVLMLSLIGLPPFAGFFAKLYMFMEVLNSADAARTTMLALVALALLNTVISAFYYVRVLKAMFLRRAETPRIPATRSVALPIGLSALVAVGFGLFPSLLLEPMRTAAGSMLSISMPLRGTDIDEEYDPSLDPDMEPDDSGEIPGMGTVRRSEPPTAPPLAERLFTSRSADGRTRVAPPRSEPDPEPPKVANTGRAARAPASD